MQQVFKERLFKEHSSVEDKISVLASENRALTEKGTFIAALLENMHAIY
jgi:hypothetical protein